MLANARHDLKTFTQNMYGKIFIPALLAAPGRSNNSKCRHCKGRLFTSFWLETGLKAHIELRGEDQHQRGTFVATKDLVLRPS